MTDPQRGYRFAGTPRWLGAHLLVFAGVVGMGLLGHWQLDVSERKGFSLQNFGYALQWWAFSLFAIVFWAKILRDRARGSSPAPAPPPAAAEPVTYRRYVMPQSTDGAPHGVDTELAAYNAYLAALDERQQP